MKTTSTTIEILRNRLARVESELAEAQRRMPAHSVKPPQMAALLALEDEREALLEQIKATGDGDP